jgi:hypothetical protein
MRAVCKFPIYGVLHVIRICTWCICVKFMCVSYVIFPAVDFFCMWSEYARGVHVRLLTQFQQPQHPYYNEPTDILLTLSQKIKELKRSASTDDEVIIIMFDQCVLYTQAAERLHGKNVNVQYGCRVHTCTFDVCTNITLACVQGSCMQMTHKMHTYWYSMGLIRHAQCTHFSHMLNF